MAALLAAWIALGAGARVCAALPLITAHPQDVTCIEGDGVNPLFSLGGGRIISFAVTVEGSGSFTYQWQKDDADIAELDGVNIATPDGIQLAVPYSPHYIGVTSRTLFITDCGMADAGAYRVKVRNADGEATSNPATLTVQKHPPPVIHSHPKNVTVTEGDSAATRVSMSVNDSIGVFPPVADAGLTYQWQRNGEDLPPSNSYSSSSHTASFSNTLEISAPVVADSGTYRVRVGNRWGGATYSDDAILTVLPPAATPVITSQPANVTVQTNAAGGGYFQEVEFSVVATGATRYQWQKDGVDLPADCSRYVQSTNTPAPFDGLKMDYTALPNLRIVSLLDSDAGTYRVKVWNSSGTVFSSEATLTITHPTVAATGTQTAVAGRDVTISATLPGNPQSGFQWQVSSDGGRSWTNVANNATYSGATTGVLTISNASTAMNNYQYKLTAAGQAGSAPVTLSVVPQALPHPVGVACDPVENVLYVSDDTLHTIKKVDLATGIATILAGGEGKTGAVDATGTNARFNLPKGMTLQGSALYVADSGNALIRKITPEGAVTTISGLPGTSGIADGARDVATYTLPTDIAAPTADSFVIADMNAHTVRTLDSSGAVSTLAGLGNSPGGSDGICSGQDIFPQIGGTLSNDQAVSARLNHPAAVATYTQYTSNGYFMGYNVYVADSYNHTIRLIDSVPVTIPIRMSTLAGLEGLSGSDDGNGLDARFNQPGGIAYYNWWVYVADTGNSTIRMINEHGDVVTIAGLPGVTGHRDGLGSEAMFNHPTGLALNNGKLYVADTGNAAIRELDLASGRVTTLNIIPVPAATGTSGTGTGNDTPNPGTGNGSNTGGGGGGGAASLWYALAVCAVLIARAVARRNGG